MVLHVSSLHTLGDKPLKNTFSVNDLIFQIGGLKAGCFDSYPSHSEDPYMVKKKKGSEGEKRIFRPSQGPKSTPTRSIINQNVERRINNLNFRQPITVSI